MKLGYAQCTPRLNDPELMGEPAIDFTSGYVLRALHTLRDSDRKRRGAYTKTKDLSMLSVWTSRWITMEFKAAPGGATPNAGLAQHG